MDSSIALTITTDYQKMISEAKIAQLVEQLLCKHQVKGSSPFFGSTCSIMKTFFNRQSSEDISDIFLHRYSPRVMEKTAIITKNQLLTAFEAARWTWSSFNLQPWRFVYGIRGDSTFDTLHSVLTGGNEVWTNEASALIAILINTQGRKDTINSSADFDTGSATFALAMQLALDGWATHPMGGLDRIQLKQLTKLPDHIDIHCMLAVGKSISLTPDTHLSTRQPIEELAKNVFEF